MIKILLPFFLAFFPLWLFSQDYIKTNASIYSIGDTVVVEFKCTLGLIYSNFGGCGSGVVYSASCIENPEFSTIQVECDYLLPEEFPIYEGTFSLVLNNPGTYKLITPIFEIDNDGQLLKWENKKLESEAFLIE